MKYVLLLALALLLTACPAGSTDEGGNETVETALPEMQGEVTVETLRVSDFYHELVSNGKLAATQYVDLRFESAEPVEAIWVKNGDVVAKGQKLAELSPFRLKIRTEQAKDALDRAALELQDVLIGQGYTPADSAAIPPAIMQLARTRSGYDQAEIQYRLALYEEEHATLTAPFAGVVANLFAKPFHLASTSEVFCSIIGANSMEASFTVLENELPFTNKGDRVKVAPYFTVQGEGLTGYISEINPVVGENGMVRVKASVPAGNARLFEGMNVWVSIQHTFPQQLVIPKTALVIRSGKQVVFTYADGKAQWNYVQTGLENAASYTIVEGLREGDVVITSGNINLAHESTVTVIPSGQ